MLISVLKTENFGFWSNFEKFEKTFFDENLLLLLLLEVNRCEREKRFSLYLPFFFFFFCAKQTNQILNFATINSFSAQPNHNPLSISLSLSSSLSLFLHLSLSFFISLSSSVSLSLFFHLFISLSISFSHTHNISIFFFLYHPICIFQICHFLPLPTIFKYTSTPKLDTNASATNTAVNLLNIYTRKLRLYSRTE